MWACVDDGTSLAQSDGDHTYVISTAAAGFHTTAYSGGPTGALSQVVAHVVAAAQAGASGTATVSIYDGATLVGTGAAHALGGWYAEYQDSFGVSVSSVANLRTRVTFSAANLKYTDIWVEVTSSAHDAILAGAGDIACNQAERNGTTLCGSVRCDCKDPATATQLGTIAPDLIFTLGDNQYENGALADYDANFDLFWGQHSPIRPAPGNHEYNGNANVTACGGSGNFCSASAYMRANYYGYFSAVKSQFDPNGNGWYSYDVQTSNPARPWHVVVLNAAICDSASLTWANAANCSSTSAQVQWLNGDLAANAGKCILAYWHEPRFSAAEHGNNTAYTPFWAALHAARADVILQGHDHAYERYPALAANGVPDSSGPISFVVGTGGRDSGGCHAATPSPSVCQGNTFGAMKLTLHPNSWEYDFTSVAGTAISDRSAAPIACHN